MKLFYFILRQPVNVPGGKNLNQDWISQPLNDYKKTPFIPKFSANTLMNSLERKATRRNMVNIITEITSKLNNSFKGIRMSEKLSPE